jgi:hypothetical protein
MAYSASRTWAGKVTTLGGTCLLATALASVGARPAMAGFPFVTDDSGTQGTGHVELDLYVQYSRFSGGSTGSLPAVSFAYGVTDNFDLTLGVPMTMAQTNGVGTNVGIGDISAGFKFRFIDEDTEGWRPGLAFAPSVYFPTGSQARGTGAGYFRAFLPVWLSKSSGDWTFFTGGGLNINQGTIGGVKQTNWWYAGAGVTYQINDTWTVGSEIYYTSPVETGAKDLVGFNVGVIYSLAPGHNLMATVGRNIVNAMYTNQFSTLLAYQLKF